MTLAAVEQTIRANTRGAKVLTLDIERLPGIAYAWEPKTRYIAPRNFIAWPRMICFAARWYDNPRPIFHAAWHKTGHAGMVEAAWKLYDQADAVISFNGVRFDDKHLRSEWLLEGLAPPSPWKAIDLYKQAGKFGFESKSLDSLTRRLGRPGKEHHYSISLAEDAAAGNKAAQAELRTYNIGDIELTEWLYDRLLGWMPNHPHLGHQSDDKTCNQCGGTDLKLLPSRYRAVVIDYALYRCLTCGGHVRGGWHSRAATTRGIA